MISVFAISVFKCGLKTKFVTPIYPTLCWFVVLYEIQLSLRPDANKLSGPRFSPEGMMIHSPTDLCRDRNSGRGLCKVLRTRLA